MKTPLIIDIKGNSLDDGPGIRSVIFFKGCPLSCVWCHNPESKCSMAELSFDLQKCIACDTCIGMCNIKALSRESAFFVDRKKCTLCFECIKVCPSGALSQIGCEYTVDEIIEKIVKDKPFYDASGGGVTLSGGEPTMYMEFLSDLLTKLKNRGIHTLIETCGYFNFQTFKELVYPHTDTIYMDIKFVDSKLHKQYCGADNALILENFIKLHELYLLGGVEVKARVPLIPDITDCEKNLSAIAHFLKAHQAKDIQLLPNNPIWHEKCQKFGIENCYEKDSKMNNWLPQDRMDSCKEIFTGMGIAVNA